MKNIKQVYKIKAPIKEVWQALINPKIIAKWGGGPAKMTPKEGANFTLWGGDILGKNIKVVKEKELTQEWLEKGWKKPSEVTFKLIEGQNQTKVILIHKNIPGERAADISQGWKDYYLGLMKEYLEK
jgi:activator of HSP90 ATPase